MDQAMIDRVDRPGEFAADEIMRDIRGQPEIREAIQQLQGEEQIGRHAIAVRFDVHRHVRVVGDAAPPFDERDAVFQTIRAHVRL